MLVRNKEDIHSWQLYGREAASNNSVPFH